MVTVKLLANICQDYLRRFFSKSKDSEGLHWTHSILVQDTCKYVREMWSLKSKLIQNYNKGDSGLNKYYLETEFQLIIYFLLDWQKLNT